MEMEERIENQLVMIESGNIEGFLNDIDQMPASKAYLVIRDNLASKHVTLIKNSGKDNYQKFQDIKNRAKQSWDYDHRHATMEDVNRACMNVYTLVLKIMKIHSDATAEELNQIRSAINKLEEQVGAEVTNWDSTDDNGGNQDVSNVQGVEENP